VIDVAVVGGGIIGLATARQLRAADPRLQVAVLEREPGVGHHQSSHNSGVLHAGVYYTPGSLKAALCRSGYDAMRVFCADHDIPVRVDGKVVVAVERRELARFDALVARATANGVPGLDVLDGDELRAVEPEVAGIRALRSPTTAIVDFGAVCAALAAELEDVRATTEVHRVVERSDGVQVETNTGEVMARTAVVCAGLRTEQLAAASGVRADVRIVPFRGSWVVLRRGPGARVRGNVYPVPDPDLPFLGVHLTRRPDGAVWAGPNAVLSLRADSAVLARALRFAGLPRLLVRHWRAGAVELWRDTVRRAYAREIARYLPGIRVHDLEPGPRPFGVRAQAVARDGALVDDFVIEGAGRALFVLNAPSPGATSALAIGERLAATVRERL
jgi:L-2-hydroxyglutarate oxidase LhgO